MSFNHFDYVPSTVDRRRSTFKFDKAIAKGIDLGFLYPLCKPVRMMPGSSISLSLAAEIRSGALIRPMMDEMYCDFFSFFVPNRIVWEHWKQFVGAVDDVLFNNLTQYSIPSFKLGLNALVGNTGWTNGEQAFQWSHTLAANYGLPFMGNTGDTPESNAPIISALPFRGYTFIWNEFFRPEQLVAPLVISKTDDGWAGDNMEASIPTAGTSFNALTIHLLNPTGYATSPRCQLGGCVMPVYRVNRDLWTSCLPAPSLETLNLLAGLTAPVGMQAVTSGTLSSDEYIVVKSGTMASVNEFFQLEGNSNSNVFNTSKVFADLNQAILTVNNYRETIMLQNYYDVLNRAGSRYDEIIRNIFGVTTSNAVTDIPELITHKRFTIYRNQVVATAESVDGDGQTVSPVGSQAAYIDTIVTDSFFTRSTTEHGYIHLLMAIRPARIRSNNGIEPEWLELEKFDQYYPQFDGMGDVARRKIEKYYDFGLTFAAQKDAILGYQEYGAQYKYERSEAQGWFDFNVSQSITGFTLSESLSVAPSLVTTNYPRTGYVSCFMEWEAFGRCLAISNPTIAPQFICDIRLNGTITHPMPVYNIPGQGALL